MILARRSRRESVRFADQSALVEPHTDASRESISSCLQERRIAECAHKLPQQQLFQATLSFFATLRKQGCRGSPSGDLNPEPNLEAGVPGISSLWQDEVSLSMRGQAPKETCRGNILFEYTTSAVPYLRYAIVSMLGMISNTNNNFLDASTTVVAQVLTIISTLILPKGQYGEHPHPIPLLTRAPRPVYSALMAILNYNYRDLPDLTPRQFIRHRSMDFSRRCFPIKCHHH